MLEKNNIFKVRYFNNELTIDGVPASEYKDIRELWVSLREDYADWVAEVRLKDFGKGKSLAELLEWNGMSSWWINNLVQKDTEGDTQWLHRLMLLYFFKTYKSYVDIETDDPIIMKALVNNFPKTNFNFQINDGELVSSINTKISLLKKSWSQLRIFIRSILKWAILYRFRFDLRPESDSSNTVWFATFYPVNWVKGGVRNFQDRHLGDVPLMEHLFGMRSKFLVYVLRGPKDKNSSYYSLRNDLSELHEKTGRPVFFPESQLRIKDFIDVFLSTFREWQYFTSLKNEKTFTDLFNINGLDVSIILLEQWDNSYSGNMQYCKIHGLATMRFLETMSIKQSIVTYAELFIETRADYHLCGMTKVGAYFFALQHSHESRNYGEAYNRKSEFSQKLIKDHLTYCPMPDSFMVHGEQYRQILAGFYPKNRIKIIGSLKVKNILDKLNNKNQNELKKIKSLLGNSKKHTLIIALSNDDMKIFTEILAQWEPKLNIQILLTTHPSNDLDKVSDWVNYYLSHLDVNIITDVSTFSLLHHADMLVCAGSNLIYESLLFKIKSAILLPIGCFPYRETDNRICQFHDAQTFDKWLCETLSNNAFTKNNFDKKEIFTDYYFYPDGLAAERMWQHITEVHNM
jgi:hypothetical protein